MRDQLRAAHLVKARQSCNPVGLLRRRAPSSPAGLYEPVAVFAHLVASGAFQIIPLRLVLAHGLRPHVASGFGRGAPANHRIVVGGSRGRRSGTSDACGEKAEQDQQGGGTLQRIRTSARLRIMRASARSCNLQRRRTGPTSARMIPRMALTSRDDQPVLVKIVRSVFFVAWVREGGWK
jgi:hypothetical protein